LTLSGPEIGDREAGDIASQLHDVGAAGIPDLLVRQRRDGERHLLQRGLALLRGDDDLSSDTRAAFLRGSLLLLLLLLRLCARGCGEGRGDKGGDRHSVPGHERPPVCPTADGIVAIRLRESICLFATGEKMRSAQDCAIAAAWEL